MELNPNNPVTRAAHDKWHKICAMVMHKLGATHVEIKNEDIDALNATGCNIGISDAKGYIEVFLLTPEETKAALEKYGGMPWQS